MEYTIHRISLDIHTAKSQATLRVKQYDTSRKLHITLCEGGLPYHIATDCTATFSAIKADDKYIHNTCQIDGNTIEYTFTEQTTAAVGATECEIALYNNKGQRITSPHFTIIVEERVYNGEEIVSSSEANVLNDLIDRAEVAVDNAEKVVDSIYHYVESNFANAFKGNMSGAIVQADDVSPVEHIVGCKVRSKNLISPPYHSSTHTKDGITFVINDDGSVNVNGTATAKVIFYFQSYNTKIKLRRGESYVLSGCPGTGSSSTYMLQGTNSSVYLTDIGNGKTFTAREDGDDSYYFYIVVYEGTTMNNLLFKPQLEVGTEATEYVSYIKDLSTIKLSRNGEEFSVSPDGTVNGLKSVYPTMIVTTDNVDAVVEIDYNRDSNKVVKGLYDLIMQETVVNTKVSSVKLLADAWVGDKSPYSQVVSIPGVTENSMVDLTPSVEQLAVFHNKDLAFVTENVGGVVTVYAIGQKPTNDYTIPVAITEVKA